VGVWPLLETMSTTCSLGLLHKWITCMPPSVRSLEPEAVGGGTRTNGWKAHHGCAAKAPARRALVVRLMTGMEGAIRGKR
jgi:hypothetical protein